MRNKKNCEKCSALRQGKSKDDIVFRLKNAHENLCESCAKGIFIEQFENQHSMGNWNDKSDVEIITSLLIPVIKNDPHFQNIKTKSFFKTVLKRHIDLFLSNNRFDFLKRNDKAKIKTEIKYELLPIVERNKEKSKKKQKNDYSFDFDGNELQKDNKKSIDKMKGLNYKRLGRGLHYYKDEEVMYFSASVKFDDDDTHTTVTLTSNRKIFFDRNPTEKNPEFNQIKQNFGLDYTYPIGTVLRNKITPDIVRKYVNKLDEKQRLKQLFEDIADINRKYIVHQFDYFHEEIACEIISTYFTPLFQSVGHRDIHAEKGSGKSTQTDIYKLLACNSVASSSELTTSSFFRSVEAIFPTFIMDNFDLEKNEEKKEALENLIQVAYKKANPVMRSTKPQNKSDFEPTSFKVFCPIILNRVKHISDVTKDRCNTIRMLKSKDDITRNEINEDDIIWKDLSERLYFYALQSWKKVREAYNNLDSKLTGRSLEKVKPILTIASMVDKKLKEKIENRIAEQKELTKSINLRDDWLFQYIKTIYESFEEGLNILKIKHKTIVDTVASEIIDGFNPVNDSLDNYGRETPRDVKNTRRKMSYTLSRRIDSLSFIDKYQSSGMLKLTVDKKGLETYIINNDWDEHIKLDNDSDKKKKSILDVSSEDVEKLEEEAQQEDELDFSKFEELEDYKDKIKMYCSSGSSIDRKTLIQVFEASEEYDSKKMIKVLDKLIKDGVVVEYSSGVLTFQQ